MILCAFLLFAGSVYGQSKPAEIDERLLLKYDQEHLQRLQQRQPQLLAYFTFFLDNGYFLTNTPAEKARAIPEVSLPPEGIAAFALNAKRDANRRVYYRIKGSAKMIVLYSEKELAKKFNEHQQRSTDK